MGAAEKMHRASAATASVLLPATDPRRPWRDTRLLRVPGPDVVDTPVVGLLEHLQAGDVLVLNDAATLPASLDTVWDHQPIELRLAGPSFALDAMHADAFPARWWAVVFGEGSWRDDTDTRPPPPPLPVDARLGWRGMSARVRSSWGRLVELEFAASGDALAAFLYAAARPVQYRHLHAPLELHQVQTPYGQRPWAVEMASTGRPLRWPLLRMLEARGVELAWLTHAAGLSATGSAALDAALPLPERYDVPPETLQSVARAKARGRRVVAVGTTVVRALESCALAGWSPGLGLAELRIDRHHALRAVDGILTGVHSPGESHWDLLGAFADRDVLEAAHEAAVAGGYLAHEFGDLMLIL